MALKTEQRTVSGFHAIELSGAGTLEIVQDATAAESLVVEADEAVLPRLKSEVEDGVLKLGFDMPWLEWLGWGLEWLLIADKTIRFRVGMKEITGVTLSGAAVVKSNRLQSEGEFRLTTSGAGKAELGELEAKDCRILVSGTGTVHIGRISADSLATTISGTGDLDLGGEVKKHDLRISGVGKVRANGLKTQRTHLTISGSGNAEIAVEQALDVSISGTGDVRYNGSPMVTQSVSGAGRVHKAG